MKWTKSSKGTITKTHTAKTDNLNRTIFIKYIESIMNILPKQKAAGQNKFTGEFFQIFKKNNCTKSL